MSWQWITGRKVGTREPSAWGIADHQGKTECMGSWERLHFLNSGLNLGGFCSSGNIWP